MRPSIVLLALQLIVTTGCSTADQKENDGTPPAAAAWPDSAARAAGVPDWLQKYPNVQSMDIDESSWHADSTSMGFLTSDRATKVLDFYVTGLKAAGFTVNDTPSSGTMAAIGGGTFLTLTADHTRDGTAIHVEIAILEQDSTTTQVHGSWKRTK